MIHKWAIVHSLNNQRIIACLQWENDELDEYSEQLHLSICLTQSLGCQGINIMISGYLEGRSCWARPCGCSYTHKWLYYYSYSTIVLYITIVIYRYRYMYILLQLHIYYYSYKGDFFQLLGCFMTIQYSLYPLITPTAPPSRGL